VELDLVPVDGRFAREVRGLRLWEDLHVESGAALRNAFSGGQGRLKKRMIIELPHESHIVPAAA